MDATDVILDIVSATVGTGIRTAEWLGNSLPAWITRNITWRALTLVRDTYNPLGKFKNINVRDLVEIKYQGAMNHQTLPVLNTFLTPPTPLENTIVKLFKKEPPVVGMVVAKWDCVVTKPDGSWYRDTRLAVLVGLQPVLVKDIDWFWGVRLEKINICTTKL